MTRKVIIEVLQENLPELEEPCPICILTKENKIPRGPTIDVSKLAPGFMLQMDLVFSNVESIRGFTSIFVAICSVTSHPFGFPSRKKRPPLDNLKFLVTTLRNHDKKVVFIRSYEDWALAISSEFMRTCHNMNIMVQTTCGDASSLNGKSEIPNKTLSNNPRYLLLNSSHKGKLWWFAYQYAIWLYRQTDNRLRGDVPYFLWYGTRPSYKHIKILGMRVYFINGRATRINFMIDPIEVISWDMQLMQDLFYTGNQINYLLFRDPIMFGLMNIILISP